jgi:hypothetical protein
LWRLVDPDGDLASHAERLLLLLEPYPLMDEEDELTEPVQVWLELMRIQNKTVEELLGLMIETETAGSARRARASELRSNILRIGALLDRILDHRTGQRQRREVGLGGL